MKRLIAIAALGLSLTATASAEKRPVSLDCSADNSDTIGLRFCAELRDDIARSPRYEEVPANDQDAHWALIVLTLNTDDGKLVSAQSTTINLAPKGGGLAYYMTSYITITGQNKVAIQASAVLAALDKIVAEAEKIISESKDGKP